MRPASRKAVMSHNEATEYTVAASTHDAGYFSALAPPARWRAGESDLHSSGPAEPKERMLLSFQGPSRLLGVAGAPRRRARRRADLPERTNKDSNTWAASQPQRPPLQAHEPP